MRLVGRPTRRRGDRSDWQTTRIARWTTQASLLSLLFLGAVAPTALGLYNLSVQAAWAEAWLPEGVPCREISAAAFEEHTKSELRRFGYGGFVLGRKTGHVQCETVSHWAREFVGCKFSSPQVISVTGEGRTAYFEVGLGNGAALQAMPDKLVCIRVTP